MVGVAKRHAARVRLACWPGTPCDMTHHASCVWYLFFTICRVMRPRVAGHSGEARGGGWCVADGVSCPRLQGGTERGGEGEGPAAPPNAAGMTLPAATRTLCFLYCVCSAVLPLLWSGAEGTVSASNFSGRPSLPARTDTYKLLRGCGVDPLAASTALHSDPPPPPPALTAAELGRRTWTHPRRPGRAPW